MEVYVLVHGCDYEGTVIRGVYETEEFAKAGAEKLFAEQYAGDLFSLGAWVNGEARFFWVESDFIRTGQQADQYLKVEKYEVVAEEKTYNGYRAASADWFATHPEPGVCMCCQKSALVFRGYIGGQDMGVACGRCNNQSHKH